MDESHGVGFYRHVINGYSPHRFGYWNLERAWLDGSGVHILFHNGLEYVMDAGFLISFICYDGVPYRCKAAGRKKKEAIESAREIVVLRQRRVQEEYLPPGTEPPIYGELRLYLSNGRYVRYTIDDLLTVIEPYSDVYGWFGELSQTIIDSHSSSKVPCVRVVVNSNRIKRRKFLSIQEIFIHRKSLTAEVTLVSGDTLYYRMNAKDLLSRNLCDLPYVMTRNDRAARRERRATIEGASNAVRASMTEAITRYMFENDYRLFGHEDEYKDNCTWIATPTMELIAQQASVSSEQN